MRRFCQQNYRNNRKEKAELSKQNAGIIGEILGANFSKNDNYA